MHMTVLVYQSPVAPCLGQDQKSGAAHQLQTVNSDNNASGAVSARNVLGPRVTLTKPPFTAAASSWALKPPSGPLRTVTAELSGI